MKLQRRTCCLWFQVAWLRVNTQTILTIASHVITKNHRIAVTHTDHRTWYLHIRDIKESDQGDYMCQINTDPMKSQVGYLQVVGEFTLLILTRISGKASREVDRVSSIWINTVSSMRNVPTEEVEQVLLFSRSDISATESFTSIE